MGLTLFVLTVHSVLFNEGTKLGITHCRSNEHIANY